MQNFKIKNFDRILQRPNQVGIAAYLNIANDIHNRSIFIGYIPIQILLLYIQKEFIHNTTGRSFSGKTSACHAEGTGSNPVARSI